MGCYTAASHFGPVKSQATRTVSPSVPRKRCLLRSRTSPPAKDTSERGTLAFQVQESTACSGEGGGGRCQPVARPSLYQIHTSSHTAPTFTGSNYTMKTTLRE